MCNGNCSCNNDAEKTIDKYLEHLDKVNDDMSQYKHELYQQLNKDSVSLKAQFQSDFTNIYWDCVHDLLDCSDKSYSDEYRLMRVLKAKLDLKLNKLNEK